MRDTSTKLEVARHVVGSVHSDGLVLLDARAGRILTTNRTGARIWQGVEERLTAEVIARELSREYGISYATAHDHTLRFVDDLRKHNLVAPEVRR